MSQYTTQLLQDIGFPFVVADLITDYIFYDEKATDHGKKCAKSFAVKYKGQDVDVTHYAFNHPEAWIPELVDSIQTTKFITLTKLKESDENKEISKPPIMNLEAESDFVAIIIQNGQPKVCEIHDLPDTNRKMNRLILFNAITKEAIRCIYSKDWHSRALYICNDPRIPLDQIRVYDYRDPNRAPGIYGFSHEEKKWHHVSDNIVLNVSNRFVEVIVKPHHIDQNNIQVCDDASDKIIKCMKQHNYTLRVSCKFQSHFNDPYLFGTLKIHTDLKYYWSFVKTCAFVMRLYKNPSIKEMGLSPTDLQYLNE